MSEWQGTKERTAQAFRQEPLWDLLGVQPGREFRADLHAHTTLSDGSDSFLELMGKARVRGVTHLAVTNHDTTVGLDAVRQQAAEHGFSVVCGVEISAWDSTAKRRVHLLGLGMPADAPAVRDLCSGTLERRTANTAWQMRQLLDAGYDVDVEYAAQLAGQSTGFYKQHLMAALTDAAFSSAEYQFLYKTLFKGGFGTGHGFLREPNDIRSYSALACIAIQANQNDQHGGQSIPNFEYGLAPGVAKTFIKELCLILDLYNMESKDAVKAGLRAYIEENESILDEKGLAFVREILTQHAPALNIDFAVKKALEYTEKATYQAMEALVHNLNTMHSRAGAQIPFSSINYGTDTSPEGRMVIRNVLLATEAGLGNGETPIFPIHIFKVKEGVNFREGEPNYDLFKLACRVSAKRLFPNFSFIDAPFNLAYYKPGHPETEIAYMGCRTRVMANMNDPSREIVNGRGNLSFTSINLPRLGILADHNVDAFFAELDKMVDLVFEQLLERLEIQSCKKCKNYPFLMGQGIWIDSERLGPDDEVREVLKHGTLTVGFIGLAECLKALIGKHHGESEEAQELGLKIVGFIREKADKKAAETKLNFSVIATPAEGLSGKFVRLDRKRFGSIEGITDKDYYTNSFHIPVYYSISAYNKIRLEAPYHAMTNGGHITYVEVDGDPVNNLEAFEDLIRAMKDMGVGYGSINHPVDRDPLCGYTGIIGDVCPRCGRHDGECVDIEVLRKIKGYIRDVRSEEERLEAEDKMPNMVI